MSTEPPHVSGEIVADLTCDEVDWIEISFESADLSDEFLHISTDSAINPAVEVTLGGGLEMQSDNREVGDTLGMSGVCSNKKTSCSAENGSQLHEGFTGETSVRKDLCEQMKREGSLETCRSGTLVSQGDPAQSVDIMSRRENTVDSGVEILTGQNDLYSAPYNDNTNDRYQNTYGVQHCVLTTPALTKYSALNTKHTSQVRGDDLTWRLVHGGDMVHSHSMEGSHVDSVDLWHSVAYTAPRADQDSGLGDSLLVNCHGNINVTHVHEGRNQMPPNVCIDKEGVVHQYDKDTVTGCPTNSDRRPQNTATLTPSTESRPKPQSSDALNSADDMTPAHHMNCHNSLKGSFFTDKPSVVIHHKNTLENAEASQEVTEHLLDVMSASYEGLPPAVHAVDSHAPSEKCQVAGDSEKCETESRVVLPFPWPLLKGEPQVDYCSENNTFIPEAKQATGPCLKKSSNPQCDLKKVSALDSSQSKSNGLFSLPPQPTRVISLVCSTASGATAYSFSQVVPSFTETTQGKVVSVPAQISSCSEKLDASSTSMKTNAVLPVQAVYCNTLPAVPEVGNNISKQGKIPPTFMMSGFESRPKCKIASSCLKEQLRKPVGAVANSKPSPLLIKLLQAVEKHTTTHEGLVESNTKRSRQTMDTVPCLNTQRSSSFNPKNSSLLVELSQPEVHTSHLMPKYSIHMSGSNNVQCKDTAETNIDCPDHVNKDMAELKGKDQLHLPGNSESSRISLQTLKRNLLDAIKENQAQLNSIPRDGATFTFLPGPTVVTSTPKVSMASSEVKAADKTFEKSEMMHVSKLPNLHVNPVHRAKLRKRLLQEGETKRISVIISASNQDNQRLPERFRNNVSAMDASVSVCKALDKSGQETVLHQTGESANKHLEVSTDKGVPLSMLQSVWGGRYFQGKATSTPCNKIDKSNQDCFKRVGLAKKSSDKEYESLTKLLQDDVEPRNPVDNVTLPDIHSDKLVQQTYQSLHKQLTYKQEVVKSTTSVESAAINCNQVLCLDQKNRTSSVFQNDCDMSVKYSEGISQLKWGGQDKVLYTSGSLPRTELDSNNNVWHSFDSRVPKVQTVSESVELQSSLEVFLLKKEMLVHKRVLEQPYYTDSVEETDVEHKPNVKQLEQELSQILTKIEDAGSGCEKEAGKTSSTCCNLQNKGLPARDPTFHRHSLKRGLLPKLAIKIMERWYQQNIKHPYPSQETAESLALSGEIAPEQLDVKFSSSYEVPPRFQRRLGKISTSQNVQSDVEVRLGPGATSSGSWEKNTASQVATAVNKQRAASPQLSPPQQTKKQSPVKTDYKSAINLFVQYHQYAKPIYDTISVGNRNSLKYKSTVIIKDTPYGTQEPYLSKKEAEQGAAKQACAKLNIDVDNMKVSKPSKEPAVHIDDNVLKERIVLILKMKPNGLFSRRLASLYREAYDCEPPDQQYLDKKIAEWTDVVKVEDIAATKTRILYPVLQSNIKLTQSAVSSHDVVPDPVTPSPGFVVKGYVSYVVNINQFYVQRSEDIGKIEQLQQEINNTYESRGSPKQLLNAEPGCYCVAKFENAWYRAKILSVMKSEQQELYKLFYIDYGNCEKVSSLRIRRILDNFATLPGHALQCSLASVYPKGDTWDKEVLNKFINIYDFSEEMKIEVVSVEDCCCSVRLYSGALALSINEDVVHRGLANSSALPAEPDPIQFPSGKEWDVYVSCILSTVAVVIRIVGQNYSEQLELLEEEELPKLESMTFAQGELTAGALCAVKTHDGGQVDWYRVRVVKVQGQRADVYFLDHGDSDVVNVNVLRSLPPKYNQLPYQAISCKLTGLEGFEQDSRVLKALCECAVGKTCVADIDDKCDKLSVTLWDTSSDVDININEKVSTVLTIEDLKPKLPLEGDTVEGYVSHVTDEGKVYINIQGPGLLELNNMSEELNQIYSKTDVKLFLSSPEKGRPCVAKFVDGEYEGWYRALIKEVYQKQRKVVAFYVDYGNTQVLPFSSLRQLSPHSKYLKPLPMQALACQLYELPPKGCSFTDRVISRIVDLCPLDQLRIVEVVKQPTDDLPQVELYFVDEEEVLQGVSEILFKENLFASEEESDSCSVSSASTGFEQLRLDIESASNYQKHRLITEQELQSLSSHQDKSSLQSPTGANASEISSPTSSDRDVVEYKDLITGYDTQLQENEDFTPKSPISPLLPLSTGSSSERSPGQTERDDICYAAGSPVLSERSAESESTSAQPANVDTSAFKGDTGFSNLSETVAYLQSEFEPCSADAGQFDDSDLDNLVMPPPMSLPYSGDKVYVTWVADPGNFRCIPAQAISLLSDLMEQMLMYYTKHKNMLGLQILPQSCSEGDIAAGFYDGFWYRVSVKKVLVAQVAVHFVDYGDYTIIPLSDLRVLTASFRKLPFQAIKVRLAGVQSDGNEWSVESQSRFRDLVSEKTFTAWIHGRDQDYVPVTLLDESAAADCQMVHTILLRENLATKEAVASV